MQSCPATTDMIQGAVSVETGPGWVRPWRLVHDQHDFYYAEMLQQRAAACAGVRVRIATNSTCLKLHVQRPEDVLMLAGDDAPDLATFDLVQDNRVIASRTADLNEPVVFDGLDGQKGALEIYLPQGKALKLQRLEIDDGASLDAAPDDRPRWITYGSSITHCGTSRSPAITWPATAARLADVHLSCMGYGGQCCFDQMVARQIRDMPADMISLKLGINTHGGGFTHRTWAPAVIGFIKTVRDGHPHTPLAVISPIVSPQREDAAPDDSPTLKQMRDTLAEIVRRFRDGGDEKIIYRHGFDLFGPELVDAHLPDGLHPDSDGYEIMGRNFAEKVMPELKALAGR